MNENELEGRGDLFRAAVGAAIALALALVVVGCGSGSGGPSTTAALQTNGVGESPSDLRSELESLQSRVAGVRNADSAQTLSDLLLDFAKSTFDAYTAQLRQLSDQLKANTQALNELLQKDSRTPADEAEIARLQTESTRLSDDLKTKNVAFQSIFDLLAQVQQSLNKIIIDFAKHGGR